MQGWVLSPGVGRKFLLSEFDEKSVLKKTNAEEWLDVHRTVHSVGMKSNATMLYGHVENAEDRTDHLIRLRELQDTTNGFLTFIPLAFHPENTNLSHLNSTPGQLDLRALAVSRLMLDNFPHVKAFWIMITPQIAQMSLSFGTNDMDGTVVEEKIIHAAGGVTGQIFHKNVIADMIIEAGRMPMERDTLYEETHEYVV